MFCFPTNSYLASLNNGHLRRPSFSSEMLVIAHTRFEKLSFDVSFIICQVKEIVVDVCQFLNLYLFARCKYNGFSFFGALYIKFLRLN